LEVQRLGSGQFCENAACEKSKVKNKKALVIALVLEI
jgi:hypothetical protein